MQRYVIIRLSQAVLCIIVITMIVFALVRIAGDPVSMMLPPEATPEEHELLRAHLGLDKSVVVQYLIYLSDLLRGDFGVSILYQESSATLWLDKFPRTLQLALVSFAISAFIGISVGILSAVKAGTWIDLLGRTFALTGQATPMFWFGLMAMLLFGVVMRLLPIAGTGGPQHLVLPAITLGYHLSSSMTRLTRSSMLDVLDSEYVKMARIKGLPERVVILKHAFKNGLAPVLTLGTLQLVGMINGAVIVETILAWPGVGRLMVDAIYARDYPVVQTCLLFAAFFMVIGNLFVDIAYCYIDPRVRYEKQS